LFSSPNHFPKSINLQRWEQNGPYLPSNQSPAFRQVGHLLGFMNAEAGEAKFRIIHLYLRNSQRSTVATALSTKQETIGKKSLKLLRLTEMSPGSHPPWERCGTIQTTKPTTTISNPATTKIFPLCSTGES
jgi:hypothetical protein